MDAVIKSKFHENKDWNWWYPGDRARIFRTSRASSTKTRIETFGWWALETACRAIKSKFHENKDWNPSRMVVLRHHSTIKSKFHENKDWNTMIYIPYYIA